MVKLDNQYLKLHFYQKMNRPFSKNVSMMPKSIDITHEERLPMKKGGLAEGFATGGSKRPGRERAM